MFISENRVIVKEKVSVTKDRLMHSAISAMSLAAKNIYNTALFHIHAAYLAGKLSDYDVPNEHQLTVFHRYNHIIAKINEARIEKAETALTNLLYISDFIGPLTYSDYKKITPKLLSVLELGSCPASVILDATVLDSLIREYCPDYKAVPAIVAQQVLRQVTTNYTSYFKALTDYLAHPSKYKGRPQRPQYLPKHGHFMLRFNANGGKVSLGSLKNRVIFEDYERKTPLSADAIARYETIDAEALINKAKSRYAKGYQDDLSCVEIRVVPLRSQFKVEVVFKVSVEIASSSFLSTVAIHYALTAKKESDRHPEKFFALSLAKQSDIIFEYLNNPAHLKKSKTKNKVAQTSATVMPATAGIDLGLNNIATVSYSTGNKGAVYSATKFNAVMDKFDRQLNKIKSTVMSEAALKLEDKHSKKEEMTEDELSAYYSELNKVYATEAYNKLIADKAAVTETLLHKLSSTIVLNAKMRGIQLIVLGKNIGWKTEMNIGRKHNRQFHNIPHARLIELIQYKAREHSIAVAGVEEAYTSKASFVLNEAIPEYPATSTSTDRMGVRIKHSFKLKKEHLDKAIKKWHNIHADINGAFNIIRKFIKQFKFSESLSPKYHLMQCRSDFRFTLA